MRKLTWAVLLIIIILSGCLKNNSVSYNGRLEADVTKIYAQTTGLIKNMSVDEGESIVTGQILTLVDTDALRLNREQLAAQLKLNNDLLVKNQKLMAKGAATEQRVAELTTTVVVLQAQIRNLDLQIADAEIRSPLSGIVVNTFVKKGEYVRPGSIVAEVADLTKMTALIYLPLTELAKVNIGEKVSLRIDGVKNDFPAQVTWISTEAEFTPKTILTKETRTTLVYAVKLAVPNPEGILKIGMPLDVYLP
jgi:HlyD family secretion protein